MTRDELLVTVGVMAGIAVAALDSTVVGTAMPTIIGQLGGIEQYGWVFAAYLLTATTTVPVFSSLADVHGRKPIFLIGLALFVVGSMLCGIAASMWQLIVFRAIQGLGAGAVQPVAFTIVGDIFEPARRARMQGFFSSVWGVAAIVGPALGGLITATVGWRWTFYINVPVGILAGALIWYGLHERVERHQHRLDWVGTLLLTGGVGLLLLGVSEGSSVGFGSPLVLGMLVAAAVMLVAFWRNERAAAEPVVRFELLERPIIGAGLAITVLAGVVMFGLTAYLPPVVQGVHGGTPLEAGLVVGAMSVTWTVASITAGRSMLRFGSRPVVLAGTVALVVGTAMLSASPRIASLWYAGLGAAVVGIGMGLITTPLLVSIQSVVTWRQRGQATGLVQFSRTIGGAVGTGLMGAVLASAVGARASAILDPVGRAAIPSDELAALHEALASSLGIILLMLLAAAMGAWLLAVRYMPDINVASLGTASAAKELHDSTPP